MNRGESERPEQSGAISHQERLRWWASEAGANSTYQWALDEIEHLSSLVRRAALFVNGIAVLAEDKAPSLGWLADAERALPGEILTEPERR